MNPKTKSNCAPVRTDQTLALILSEREEKRGMFSRPIDFVLALTPITIGTGYLLIKNYIVAAGAAARGTSSMDISLNQDTSLAFTFFVFGIFLLGLGGAISVLYGMKSLEDEEKGPK